MDYKLPSVPFVILRFVFVAERDSILPRYKGSMIRGALGDALKRIVCVMEPAQNCQNCMLRRQCAYTRIFETFIEGEPPPFLKGVQTAPRPFIIDAFDEQKVYKKDQQLIFNFTLLGTACQMHSYVIFAFYKAGEKGFTARSHPFRLQRVLWHDTAFAAAEEKTDGWKTLYEGATQTLLDTPVPRSPEPTNELGSPVTLKFLTPTRMKFNGHYGMEFTFRQLVFKMLRRVLEIAHFYVPEAQPDWDFHDYLVAADKVQITARNLRWEDWHRYSNRQHTKMEMGGFVGEIVLGGDIALFSELLRVCEVVHVGKVPVLGWQWYMVLLNKIMDSSMYTVSPGRGQSSVFIYPDLMRLKCPLFEKKQYQRLLRVV